MSPFWSDRFGNASAVHDIGSDARDAVDNARAHVGRVISADPKCIMFTSGATEANNIVLQGILKMHRKNHGIHKNAKILTSNVEHSSVLNTLESMKDSDSRLLTLSICVNKDGQIDMEKLEYLIITNNLICVSVMTANNEIGSIYDIYKIGSICKKYNVFFHTDATQAIGKIDIDVSSINVDALSLSAHKIYGPKGIGALYLKNCNKLMPLITGGLQEIVTSGTTNVPAVVGFGEACRIVLEESAVYRETYRELRDRMLSNITSSLRDVSINGSMSDRLQNNLNITIKGVPSDALVLGMDDVIVSSGSACSSGSPKPSYVIEALGVEDSNCAIRIGIGKNNSKEDIDYASNRIIEVANAVRREKC